MKIKNIAIPIVISVFCLTAAPVFDPYGDSLGC